MPKLKKEKSIHIRLPERTKGKVEASARKNNRTIQQEVEVLVALGLHVREFNIDDHV